MTEQQHQRIRDQFSRQARHFHEAGLTLSNQDYLRWVVDCMAPQPDWQVLDVAAGTGLLSRTLAARVKQVTAIDLTDAMISAGRTETVKAGITNLVFEKGTAESLPYPTNHFDLVATRFSFHHFAAHAGPLAEMVRVCKPGGRVAVCDLLSPDNPDDAARYNDLERRRDPSHTRALTLNELQCDLASAGLQNLQTFTRDIPVVAEKWLAMTHTPAADQAHIELALRSEIADPAQRPLTGMRPFLENDTLQFLHRWAVVIGRKSS